MILLAKFEDRSCILLKLLSFKLRASLSEPCTWFPSEISLRTGQYVSKPQQYYFMSTYRLQINLMWSQELEHCRGLSQQYYLLTTFIIHGDYTSHMLQVMKPSPEGNPRPQFSPLRPITSSPTSSYSHCHSPPFIAVLGQGFGATRGPLLTTGS